MKSNSLEKHCFHEFLPKNHDMTVNLPNFYTTLWKNFVRWTKNIVNYLVKPLLLLNVSQKRVTNFHKVEKRENLYHWKDISWNQLTSLVKTLLSRNFCQNCVREFLQFPHYIAMGHCLANYDLQLRLIRENDHKIVENFISLEAIRIPLNPLLILMYQQPLRG